MLRHAEIMMLHWFMGGKVRRRLLSVPQNRQNSPNYAQGIVRLQKNAKSGTLIRTLQQELDRAFPQAQNHSATVGTRGTL